VPLALDQDRASQIDLILRQVDGLPTLSPIATRLMEITNVEDANLDRLVEVLESDPALSARLLGLCRRADKGLGDRITTVRRAVVMLGLEAVQAAVLSVAVYDLMQSCSPRLDEPASSSTESTLEFDRAGFWMHSVAVASACDLIAESHSDLGVKPEEAFVAGLLHDLGKLVLELILPRSYARVLGLAERRAISAAEAELRIIGMDHHTAGKRLAEHWGLPAALAEVMWLHGSIRGGIDTLPAGPRRNLVSIVTVARTLCRHLHLGWSGDFNHPEPLAGSRGICRHFGLNSDIVDAATLRLHESVLHRCKILGLEEPEKRDVLMQSLAAANRRLGRLSEMFEQRSRASVRQSRVLTAISEFQARLESGLDINQTMAEVVRSAINVLGAAKGGAEGNGFFAVLYQAREDEEWRLCRFDDNGTALRSVQVESPGNPTTRRPASLAELCRSDRLSIASLSLLPWLTDHLVDAGDLRRVQLLPLTNEGDAALAESRPVVILIHDRDVSGTLDRQMLHALTSTWSAAISAAVIQDAARRLSERLAASNRSLAEAQQRLAETESLARLGEMAAGAAHEMNNPLTVISGRAQLLAARLTGAETKAAAEGIVEASERLTDLITSLRLLAAPPTPALTECGVEDLVQAALQIARRRTGIETPVEAHISRSNAPDGGPGISPSALLDKDMITTALAELLANALQASSGTLIRVRAHTTPADRRLVFVVDDKGIGMSPRALQHAFDPFFSERPAGRGQGLGLTRARRLVELHEGDITLHSRPGQGTTATVTIPLRPAGGH
jgi:signal transduction histidine kinase/HD-like signal output (HDOD) protein